MKLEPVIGQLEGVNGEKLSFEWRLSGIPEDESISNAILYFNVTEPETQAIICVWDPASQTPIVTNRGRSIFGNRILVSYISNSYKLTLNNLQYSDNGSYLLQVAVGKSALSPDLVIRVSIITAQVKCWHKILNSGAMYVYVCLYVYEYICGYVCVCFGMCFYT